jgi:hypothetical protein
LRGAAAAHAAIAARGDFGSEEGAREELLDVSFGACLRTWLVDEAVGLQRAFSQPLKRALRGALDAWAAADGPRSAARLHSVRGSTAGAWLLAIPYTTAAFLSPAVFRVAAAFRLGVRPPDCGQGRVCACGAALDGCGDHALLCARDGDTIRRHRGVELAWATVARSAGCLVRLEEPLGALGVRHAEADARKVMDLVIDLPDGASVLGDTTVGHPVSANAAALRRFAARPGVKAADMEYVKETKYTIPCRDAGFRFVPLAAETFGRMGGKAEAFLTELAYCAAERARGPGAGDSALLRQRFLGRWRKTLSCALQRGVALQVLGKHHRSGHAAAALLSAGDTAEGALRREWS